MPGGVGVGSGRSVGSRQRNRKGNTMMEVNLVRKQSAVVVLHPQLGQVVAAQTGHLAAFVGVKNGKSLI